MSLEKRLQALPAALLDPQLLAGRGLGNEIGFYVFDYPPEREPDVQRAVPRLLGELQAGGVRVFVSAALGGQKAGESAEARIRRYFAAEFASDHIQTYKKRPIYWLFTSGKKRAFGALMYLHRYDEGTLARLRTDYLLPLQRKVDAELERAKGDLDAATSTSAKKVAEKRIRDLGEQIVELRAYDERLRHAADQRISLDLDDGVAYNCWRMRGLVYEGTDLKMADLEKKSQWKRDLLAQEAQAVGSEA